MQSPATVAVSITGVAGPDPDEDGNPVGLVCIAVARVAAETVHLERRYGDLGRDAVQERAMTPTGPVNSSRLLPKATARAGAAQLA